MAKKLRLKASIKRNSKRLLLILITIGLALGINGYIAAYILLKGPSESVSNLIVATFMETRRGKYVMRLFLSQEELDVINAKNDIIVTDKITDYIEDDFELDEEELDKIELIDISGPTYKGILMVVHDPSRIHLAVNSLYDPDKIAGHYVEEYVADMDGIAGLNAGGFDDPNGTGDGSIPQGIVVYNGELIYGKESTYDSIIGFNIHHRLIIGKMTGGQAIEYGLQEAVTFGPPLIINYEPQEVTGSSGGLNPRSAIGQREDGAVLLLAIDGRQTTSLGATYSDIIDIMMEYGAMNAANLDGGHSTCMVYDGKIINNPVSLYGERAVPTAWVVK